MASIGFVDGRPSASIDVYLSEVRKLLDVFVLDDRPLTEHPRVLQEELMGRALGRAVAHEIGHFVFGSSDHSRSGLMRPTYRVNQLIGGPDQPFTVIEPSTCAQHQ
jgi:hypothetical protein